MGLKGSLEFNCFCVNLKLLQEHLFGILREDEEEPPRWYFCPPHSSLLAVMLTQQSNHPSIHFLLDSAYSKSLSNPISHWETGRNTPRAPVHHRTHTPSTHTPTVMSNLKSLFELVFVFLVCDRKTRLAIKPWGDCANHCITRPRCKWQN